MAGENLIEHTESCIEAKLRSGAYTCLPGVVTNTPNFEKNQTVTVRPLIGRLLLDGDYIEPPEIINAPVVFPSGGGGVITFPVSIGDGVLILYSMRDIDNWSISDGKNPLPPNTSRHHSLTDAIVIPGLYTRTSHLKPSTKDVVLKYEGSNVTIKKGGDVEVSAKGDLKATSEGDATVTAKGKIVLSGTTIEANGNGGGVVTTQSINPITGTPFPHGSSTVKAGM